MQKYQEKIINLPKVTLKCRKYVCYVMTINIDVCVYLLMKTTVQRLSNYRLHNTAYKMPDNNNNKNVVSK